MLMVEKTTKEIIPRQLQSDDFGFVKLRGKTKIPLGTAWQNKPYSYGEIQSWINRYGFNYGVISGYGGLIVIDVDIECLNKVVKDKLPDTFTVKTPRPGHHYYYFCKGISNKIVLSKDGVHSGEIISGGAQAVGAGSIHPDKGTKYEVVNDIEITEISKEEIFAALTEYIKCEVIPKGNTPLLSLESASEEVPARVKEGCDGLKPNTLSDEDTQRVRHIVKEVEERNILLGDDSYDNWLRLAFALSSMGEEGRELFHKVSAVSPKYDLVECDKQYDNALGRKGRFGGVTIATFFSYAKEAGVLQPVCVRNTDLGNSQRLVNSHGDDIRYCSTWKKWLAWNKKSGLWEIDNSGEVWRLARKAVKKMFHEAASISDSEKRKALFKWGHTSESARKIVDMVKLAESEEGIAISPEALDLNQWLLNCKNGTIDLQTGQLREHDKNDLITKVIPVGYDETAECPKWGRFLDRIMDGNQELISFLQRIVGYALTGDTREQCFFILHGDGANGKSTFIKTICALLGDYAQTAAFETFLSKKQSNAANNDIARMHGMRFISAVEAEESRRLAENVIKQVTGGDTVTARFLYGEHFEFIPQFKIFLASNFKPKINCNDPAMWRRVKLIPFTVSIPEEEQIKDLEGQLKAEVSGILNWAIKGCLEWQRNGLQTPEEVVNVTKEYRNEMDTVSAFLEERCTLLSSLRVNPTELFDAYKRYCEKNGEVFLPMKRFGVSLNNKGYEVSKSNGRAWRLGIGLSAEEQGFE